MTQTTVSLIIPAYNECESLPILYRQMLEIAKSANNAFEFIFVDDGSTDATFAVMKDLAAQDARVKAIRFSRNFGSHAACLAGLSRATGGACAFLSADLQDPPELIRDLIREWEKGVDVVLGVREWDESASRLLPRLYWRMVRRFALPNMPETGSDVFLIDRKVRDAVVTMGEKNTSIFGLILWSGFSQVLISYKKAERLKGKSKWTVGKKIKLFVDTFVAFSYFPIRMISFIGILFSVFGFVYALVVIFNRLFLAMPIEGWSSLMVIVLVTSGIQMGLLGVLGEYLWRTFDEARKRPPFIIAETIDGEGKQYDTAKGNS